MTIFFDVFPLLIFIFILDRWTRDIFKAPDKVSIEEQIGEAISKYLQEGIKVKNSSD